MLVTNDLSRSGAPQLVYQMALLQQRIGAHPVVVSPLSGPMMADFRQAGIPVIVSPRPGAWARNLCRMAPVFDAAICNTVDTADAVHLLAPILPTLWYLHEISLIEERLEHPAVTLSMQAAQRVWAGSPPCANLVKSLRPDVEVVPYGLTPLPEYPRHQGGPFRIGVFGSIEKRKGQDLVLDATILLPENVRSGIEIIFFGRALDQNLGHLISDAANNDPIVFYHQELDRKAYIDKMNKVDAVLVSSRDDTLPLVSLDALGIGKILLLAPTVGTKEWLTDGTDCIIGKETTAQGMADLIERGYLARNSGRYFNKAAKASFKNNFSLSGFNDRLEDALNKIAGPTSA
nr:glycosyltransferase family 4 protein [Sphingomonas aerolata]